MSQQVLLAIEADHVHPYVFQTSDLVEVRGACALIDRLNRLETRQIIEQAAGPESVLTADGGLALALVPDSEVEPIVQRVRRAYRAATHAVEVSAAWVPCGEEQTQRGFGDVVKAVFGLLRAAKLDRREPEVWLGHPLARTCDSCRQRPAERRDGEAWRCRGCAAKRQEQERDPATGPWMRLRWFAESAGDDVRMLRRVRPSSLEDVGHGAESAGHTGLVYCDGNGLGQRLTSLPSRERAVWFADAVNDLLEDVAFRTMLETVPIEVINGVPCLPCEPLLVGGDDLLLLAPAKLAMPLALRLLQRFEHESPDRLGGEKHFMSAAVVFAPTWMPLASQIAAASDLLRSAKRRYQETGGTTSAIDFWAMASNAPGLPSLVRETALRFSSGEDTLELTQRPLTVRRAESLLAEARQLHASRVPPRPIEAVVAGVRASRRAGAEAAVRALGSASGAQRMALARALGGSQAGDMPWRREPARGEGVFSTSIWDLAELMPFVTESAHAAG